MYASICVYSIVYIQNYYIHHCVYVFVYVYFCVWLKCISESLNTEEANVYPAFRKMFQIRRYSLRKTSSLAKAGKNKE